MLKWSFHNRRSSLVVQIIIINIFNLLILSVFNYVVFYNMNSKAFLKNVLSYNNNVTKLAFDNIDKQIFNNCAEIQQQYFCDIPKNSTILKPQTYEISKSPSDTIALTSKLSDISVNYPYIKSFDIYYEGTNTAVTGFENIHFLNSNKDKDLYLPWLKEYKKYDIPAVFLSISSNIYPYNEKVISYVFRVSQPRWGDNNIYVAMHLSPKIFSQYLDELSGELIITTNTDRILYQSSEDYPKLSYNIANYLSNSQIKTQKDFNPFSIDTDKQKMIVSTQQSQSLQLNYYYAIPHNVFYKDYNLHLRLFIISYLISIIFNLAIIFIITYMSNNIYRKRIVDVSQTAGLNINMENQGFDKSLNTLANELTSLNTIVHMALPALYQNFIRALIFGKETSGAYEKLEPLMTYSHISCLIIRAEDSTDLPSITQLQENFIDSFNNCNILLSMLEKDKIVCLLVLEEQDFISIKEQLNKQFQNSLPKCSIVSGDIFKLSKENIKRSFDSARQVLSYRFIFTKPLWLTYNDINFNNLKNTGSHLKIFTNIKRDINAENFLDLKQHIVTLVESFKIGNYTIDYCISTLGDFVTLLYNIIYDSQMDMLVVFGYDIRAYCKEISDIDAFCNWATSICEILLQNLRLKKLSIDTDLKEKIITLIDNNIQNDISIEFLADKLSMRVDVLSRIIKQSIGKNYIDYVREKKLNLAVQLLNSGLKMSEIAQRLGYNSTQYFIRIFKETYGVTPYQFKKQAIEKENMSK